MEKKDKLSPDLKEKIKEVKLDNEGRPEGKEVTCKDVVEEVKRINPDPNTLGRG